MKKVIVFLLILALAIPLAACGGGGNEPDAMKAADAYIDGFMKFYKTGSEYTEQGLQIQAGYAYGYAAASISSMRCCVDNLLYIKGGAGSLEEALGDRSGDWDEIASMNYATPYPWFFQGIIHHAKGEKAEAQICYENAAINPAFNRDYDVALMSLGSMTADELKTLKKKLVKLEDEIFAAYTPEAKDYPRYALGYDDSYLRDLAKEALTADATDYAGALRHFEAALAVNPYEGDNFAGCALMCLYLNDTGRMYYYVNEGLDADPAHEGLNTFADTLNKGGQK
jgi:tetratricopeptide (TPR) repeat protein